MIAETVGNGGANLGENHAAHGADGDGAVEVPAAYELPLHRVDLHAHVLSVAHRQPTAAVARRVKDGDVVRAVELTCDSAPVSRMRRGKSKRGDGGSP